MVDELSAHRRRIKTLSESSRSDASTPSDPSETFARDQFNVHSTHVRSRKQSIRELREEFEDYPELYGIRRSGRSRREPFRFEPRRSPVPIMRSIKRRRDVSSDDSSDCEDVRWNKISGGRSVRTRGRRVNYKVASDDDSATGSDDGAPPRSSIRSYASSQQMPFEKPKGSLVRELCSSKPVPRSNQRYKMDADGDTRSDHNGDRDSTNNDFDTAPPVQQQCDDDEVDVIEEVLTHAVRRKGATGNMTTRYNSLMEKDLNDGFDPSIEPGELQFLIKWRGWSYLHSTWETEETLFGSDRGCQVSGEKKFRVYETLLQERDERIQNAEREDLETLAYEEERADQILNDKMNVERIVSHCRGTEPHTIDYYIKWHRLDYRFCSWESGKVIQELYPQQILAYTKRRNSSLPNMNCDVLHTRPKFTPISEQPPYLGDLEDLRLRDYQLEGINWIARSWCRGNSVILADEMGLGKTIQTIGFLSYLFHEHRLFGPFLIVVPLSTVTSWQKELESWAPDMNVIIYTGDNVSRQLIRHYEWYAVRPSTSRRSFKLKFNVCITTYEILLRDKSWLSQVNWAFLGVDEAHRLKNDTSQLYKALLTFETNTRLLITGTPLQNTMRELWALLFFIMPERFSDWQEFEQSFTSGGDELTCGLDGSALSNLHKILRPFLLRRVKKDVESSLPEKLEQVLRVDMSKEQADIYRLILARNYDGLLKVTRGHKTSFINIVMELKKCCNHAHLIAPPANIDDQFSNENLLRILLRGSGKLNLLDKLLLRLKPKGHRVLIFSQMVRMLDLIADYLTLRAWGFQRLDGSIRGSLRKQALDHFNAEGSTDFCFLLSTRAGGLGINLATADTVVIFDSDWNPQNDLQAQARAHRIGQTKQVSVYRLVTQDSVEEKIIESATRKMVLDHLVIQRMDASGARGPGMKRGDTSKGQLLTEILRYGAEGLFQRPEEETVDMEVDIDEILNRAETRDVDASAESNPANALLSSFKVALELADDEPEVVETGVPTSKSWDEIIPTEMRDRLKKEESHKSLVELELGPRRRKQVKAYQAGLDVSSSSSESLDDEKNEKPQTQLTEKEVRALVRSMKRFSRPLERIDAIAIDAELPDRTEDEIKEVIDIVLNGCRAVLQNQPSIPPEEHRKSTGGKGPIFQFGRVSVAARSLLQSIEDLDVLSQYLPSDGKEARISYKLPFEPKVANWNCLWEASDDVHLLAGVYEYGYDNWEAIKFDEDLGLSSKLLPVSPGERPQANHLRSRVDYLLKTFTKLVKNDKNEKLLAGHNASSSGKKRKHLNPVEPRKQHSGAADSHNRSKLSSKNLHTPKGALQLPQPKSAEFIATDDDSSSDTDKSDAVGKVTPPKKTKHDKRETKAKQKLAPKNVVESSVSTKFSLPPDIRTLDDASLEQFHNMTGPYFSECKTMLLPIKKHFKQLEYLEDAEETDERQFSKVIRKIGDYIHSSTTDIDNPHFWKRYLWEFVQIFSKQGAADLRRIYRHAVKSREKPLNSIPNGHLDEPDVDHMCADRLPSHDPRKHRHHDSSKDRSFQKQERHKRDHSSHHGSEANYRRSGERFNLHRNKERFNNAFNRLPASFDHFQDQSAYPPRRYFTSPDSYNSPPDRSAPYGSWRQTDVADEFPTSTSLETRLPSGTQDVSNSSFHKAQHNSSSFLPSPDSSISSRDPRISSKR